MILYNPRKTFLKISPTLSAGLAWFYYAETGQCSILKEMAECTRQTAVFHPLFILTPVEYKGFEPFQLKHQIYSLARLSRFGDKPFCYTFYCAVAAC